MARNYQTWTPEQDAQLRELFEAGHPAREVATRMDRSVCSVNCRKTALGVKRGEITPPLPEAIPSEGTIEEAEQAFAASLEGSAEPRAPLVTPDYKPLAEEEPQALWEAVEKRNAREVQRVAKRGRFTAELGDKPVAIVFASDQHILEGGAVDLERMRKDAELVRATEGAYAICGGDGVENHIKHRSAMVNTGGTPSQQWVLYNLYLQLLDPLVVISGNHDAWTKAVTGVDMVHQLAEQNRLCYAVAEARLRIDVGSQTYRVAVRHQYNLNSQFNVTHCLKQWQRIGHEEFDVGCICHHHEGVAETSDYRGLPRVYVRPGSYKVTDTYSHQYGYNPTRPTCPTVVLSPDERDMVVFADLRHGLRYLNTLRS